MTFSIDDPGISRIANTDPAAPRRLINVIMLLRYLIGSAVVLDAIVIKPPLTPAWSVFFGCILFINANAVLHLWSLKSRNLPYAYRLLPYFDIGFAPVLIATTGGFLSPLILLFLLSAIGSSLLFTENKNLPHHLFSVAVISYLGVALLQKTKLILWAVVPAEALINNNRFFYPVVTGVILLFTAGYFLVRYLNARQIRMLDTLIRSFDQLIEQRDSATNRYTLTRKMEAIGRITAAIAHDFNNIIAAISGYAAMLDKKLNGNEQCQSYVRHIIDASKNASATLERLSRYGKNSVTSAVPIDLNEVIRTVIAQANEWSSPKLTITTSLLPSPSFTPGAPAQLHSMLNCLLQNAREACSGSGATAITTEHCTIHESDPLRRCFTLRADKYIRITVGDTGCGMNQEVLSRLFEPFFTTKPKNSTKGPGLSSVWYYIIDFHGAIDVESNPGAGTTVHLYLPLCQPATPLEDGPDVNKKNAEPSSRTVLIVDDEPSVREIYSEILMDAGYTVNIAKNGAEAMDFLSHAPEPTSLVLLDMIMPVMDGSETFLAIRKQYPAMKILFMSGIIDQQKMAPLLNERDTAFFQKPCDDEQLVALVQTMISRSAA